MIKTRDKYKILFLICFWEFCTIFIVFYDASVLGFKSEITGADYNFSSVLFSTVLIGLIGASMLGSMEVLVFNKIFRKKPLGLSLVVKSTIYLFFILFFTSLVAFYNYSEEIKKPLLSIEVMQLYLTHYLSARMILIIIYWGMACMLALFFLQINEKFGQGVLINFLLGRYHQPKEETRIFMFMDLKSSTSHAEKLGHIQYSRLIQDCFYDLTDIVISYQAEIYQYVGDEVVLSWRIDRGIDNNNCVNTFFAYDSLLREKKDYYKKKYGVVPEFKAGLNSGIVTVAEIGEIKKELAYHGDILNTGARIQEKCNDFQKKLLISESLKTKLNDRQQYNYECIGDVRLKGKTQSISIYSVEPKIQAFASGDHGFPLCARL